MPKVSVGFGAHDVNFPIRKFVKQVNRVEGDETILSQRSMIAMILNLFTISMPRSLRKKFLIRKNLSTFM